MCLSVCVCVCVCVQMCKCVYTGRFRGGGCTKQEMCGHPAAFWSARLFHCIKAFINIS